LAATGQQFEILAVGTIRRKMAVTPESRSDGDKAKAEGLTDRIKAWRADYEALKAEKEAESKAKRETLMAELRAKLAARQPKGATGG
jgi:hypothetical protein